MPLPARPLTRSLEAQLGRGLSVSIGGGGLLFDFGADRPDESDEFPRESSDDLARRFALVREEPVAAVQAFLSAPGDSGDLWWQRRVQSPLS